MKIKVRTKEYDVISSTDNNNLTIEDINALYQLIENAASGKLSYLRFRTNHGLVHIPSDVLKTSIIYVED
jgi:hypothetical protein